MYNDIFAFLSLFLFIGIYFIVASFASCLTLPRNLSEIATFVKPEKQQNGIESKEPKVKSNKRGAHQVVIGRVEAIEDPDGTDDFKELDSEEDV